VTRPGRTLRRALVAALVFVALGGCGMQGVETTPAKLRVIAEPKTASVYVDDRYLGSAQVLEARPQPLDSGDHLVTVRAPDYFPHDFKVTLQPGTTTVEVSLRPIPP
jgi:hypothetical protein